MIRENTQRIGNFTSSTIYNLMSVGRDGNSFGKPALTYIKEKTRERKLLRTISNSTTARPTSWGNLVEKIVLEEILSTEYRVCSQETIAHPSIDCWKGSPDAERYINGNKYAVVDIKCPYTLSSYCDFVDSFERGGIAEFRKEHSDGEKYYWQLVSNAILLGVDKAELIIFCPYLEQLESIRNFASNYDGDNQKDYLWIYYSSDNDIPYLVEDGYYKNIYKFEFDIPAEDKQLLTEKVLKAMEVING
jgi:hypothetical protein